MYSAAELIEAVQRKLRLGQRRSHPPGEFPPGWRDWLDAMAARPGALKGAPAQALVDVLLARPPRRRPPGRLADLGRWQAFASVWRLDWSDEPRDDGAVRWLAGSASVLLNLFFALSLLYLLFAPARLQPAREGEEDVVQVEFIGQGTPAEPGGGPEPRPSPEASAPTAESPPATSETPGARPPAPTAPALPEVAVVPPAPIPPPQEAVVEREVPAPQPPRPTPVQQAVTVSEPAPDTGMVFLPPPTPALEVVAAPELQVEVPAVQERDVPVVPEAAPSRPALEFRPRESVRAPDLATRSTTVEQRDVAAPVRRPALEMPVPADAAAPTLEARAGEVQERSIPAPVARPSLQMRDAPESDAPALSASSNSNAVRERTVPTPADTGGPAPASEPATGRETAEEGSVATSPSGTPADPTSGTPGGPESAPAPGGWPDPRRGDDSGASDREVQGGQRGLPDASGLYNPDGSIRMPDSPGSAAPGNPPGTHTEEIADLDRAGTWLKRPPVGYEPTMFDRYWRPNETLLQEWVRRGIKEVAIPIPGTTKSIRCAVSLLALGGGCGISDPNLNEQPAGARPPPDIPFKPALQDDNGSLPEPVDDSWD